MKRAIILLVLTLLACGGSAQATKVEQPAEPAQPESYKVGDTIEIGDWRIVVNELRTVDHDLFKPKDGNRFVVIDLSITNISDKARSYSSLAQAKLKDSTGQQYTVDVGASSAGGTLPDGEIAPNETVRGQVGYQVPESASGLQLSFEADLLGSGKVFVSLE